MANWTKEQEEAIYTEGTNIIVSAGAGSGKTAVLTERVLEKVKKGVSLNNLLILTFTKLAASEMRERIKSKLEKEGLTEELEKVETADITTFDAYSLSLVKEYHYLLNVSKDISIIDSSVISLYKRNTLKRIFDELYEKEDKDFENLVSSFSFKDDKEIFEFILSLNNKLDLKPNKKEYLNTYIDKYYSEEYINNNIKKYEEDILELIDSINNNLMLFEDAKFQDKMYDTLNNLINSSNYDEVVSSINITLPRSTKLSDADKEIKDKIKNNLDEIKKLIIVDSRVDLYKMIIGTKNNVSKIIEIVLRLDKEVYEYKKKYESYEYHDIAYLAIDLVKNNIEVRNEIKYYLNEIMIDEYQDTNDIQEEFISYIANNNVYVVGDIKQSIYKFRNANPYIFKNKYDSYSRKENGIKIDLNKNFRSREEVINNINLLFDRIMDDDIGGASYQKSHQMIFGNTSYNSVGKSNQNNDFEVYSYLNDTNYKKEEIEAFIIAKDIINKVNNGYMIFDKKGILRRIKYSDFVILMDNSKNFELFKKILEYKEVPTSIMKNSNLTDGEVIRVIKNIISLIIKIKDNVFDNEFKHLFLSLGRSFLFEIEDNTLFDYFLNKNYKDSIIYKKAKDISNRIDYLSLEELLDIIIEEYDIYNKLILIGDYQSNLLRIYKLKDIISSLVNLDYDIYKFNTYLEEILENNLKIEYKEYEESTDTVKIMTIHASKGLEFSICYYAGLYNRFNIREATSKFSYDEDYGIIIPYKDKFIENTIYHNLSYNNYVKENIGERIRLFYVALTRAKEKIILLLPQNKKDNNIVVNDIVDYEIRKKYNSFASIMYSIEGITKDYYKNIDLNSINLTRNYNLLLNDNYKSKIESNKTIIEAEELNINTSTEENKSFSKKSIHLVTKEEQETLDYGTKMHSVFELTDFSNLDKLSDKDRTMIENFISKVDIKGADIYKEYEFVYEEDNTMYHGIIDLMLVYDDKIKIIDYKLKNIEDKEYLKQLKGYKEYIENLFNKKVNTYLYSITNDNLEEIFV